jgi:hypothetical protein
MTEARHLRETPNEATARRLRGVLAEELIPHAEVARRLRMPQQSFNRRMLNQTPFTVDDITAVAKVTGLKILWLMTGEGARFGPEGCRIRAPRLPRLDSNQQPSVSLAKQVSGNVIQIDFASRTARRHRMQPAAGPGTVVPIRPEMEQKTA